MAHTYVLADDEYPTGTTRSGSKCHGYDRLEHLLDMKHSSKPLAPAQSSRAEAHFILPENFCPLHGGGSGDQTVPPPPPPGLAISTGNRCRPRSPSLAYKRHGRQENPSEASESTSTNKRQAGGVPLRYGWAEPGKGWTRCQSCCSRSQHPAKMRVHTRQCDTQNSREAPGGVQQVQTLAPPALLLGIEAEKGYRTPNKCKELGIAAARVGETPQNKIDEPCVLDKAWAMSYLSREDVSYVSIDEVPRVSQGVAEKTATPQSYQHQQMATPRTRKPSQEPVILDIRLEKAQILKQDLGHARRYNRGLRYGNSELAKQVLILREKVEALASSTGIEPLAEAVDTINTTMSDNANNRKEGKTVKPNHVRALNTNSINGIWENIEATQQKVYQDGSPKLNQHRTEWNPGVERSSSRKTVSSVGPASIFSASHSLTRTNSREGMHSPLVDFHPERACLQKETTPHEVNAQTQTEYKCVGESEARASAEESLKVTLNQENTSNTCRNEKAGRRVIADSLIEEVNSLATTTSGALFRPPSTNRSSDAFKSAALKPEVGWLPEGASALPDNISDEFFSCQGSELHGGAAETTGVDNEIEKKKCSRTLGGCEVETQQATSMMRMTCMNMPVGEEKYQEEELHGMSAGNAGIDTEIEERRSTRLLDRCRVETKPAANTANIARAVDEETVNTRGESPDQGDELSESQEGSSNQSELSGGSAGSTEINTEVEVKLPTHNVDGYRVETQQAASTSRITRTDDEETISSSSGSAHPGEALSKSQEGRPNRLELSGGSYGNGEIDTEMEIELQIRSSDGDGIGAHKAASTARVARVDGKEIGNMRRESAPREELLPMSQKKTPNRSELSEESAGNTEIDTEIKIRISTHTLDECGVETQQAAHTACVVRPIGEETENSTGESANRQEMLSKIQEETPNRSELSKGSVENTGIGTEIEMRLPIRSLDGCGVRAQQAASKAHIARTAGEDMENVRGDSVSREQSLSESQEGRQNCSFRCASTEANVTDDVSSSRETILAPEENTNAEWSNLPSIQWTKDYVEENVVGPVVPPKPENTITSEKKVEAKTLPPMAEKEMAGVVESEENKGLSSGTAPSCVDVSQEEGKMEELRQELNRTRSALAALKTIFLLKQRIPDKYCTPGNARLALFFSRWRGLLISRGDSTPRDLFQSPQGPPASPASSEWTKTNLPQLEMQRSSGHVISDTKNEAVLSTASQQSPDQDISLEPNERILDDRISERHKHKAGDDVVRPSIVISPVESAGPTRSIFLAESSPESPIMWRNSSGSLDSPTKPVSLSSQVHNSPRCAGSGEEWECEVPNEHYRVPGGPDVVQDPRHPLCPLTKPVAPSPFVQQGIPIRAASEDGPGRNLAYEPVNLSEGIDAAQENQSYAGLPIEAKYDKGVVGELRHENGELRGSRGQGPYSESLEEGPSSIFGEEAETSRDAVARWSGTAVLSEEGRRKSPIKTDEQLAVTSRGGNEGDSTLKILKKVEENGWGGDKEKEEDVVVEVASAEHKAHLAEEGSDRGSSYRRDCAVLAGTAKIMFALMALEHRRVSSRFYRWKRRRRRLNCELTALQRGGTGWSGYS